MLFIAARRPARSLHCHRERRRKGNEREERAAAPIMKDVSGSCKNAATKRAHHEFCRRICCNSYTLGGLAAAAARASGKPAKERSRTHYQIGFASAPFP